MNLMPVMPQDLRTVASPTFAGLTDSALTQTRIVYAGASGVLTDSANLTFDGTNLLCGGKLALLGSAVSSTTGIAAPFTASQSAMNGINPSVTNTISSGNSAGISSVIFISSWQPTVGSASNRSMANMYGGNGALNVVLDATEAKTFTVVNAFGYRTIPTLTSATSAAGVAKITNGYQYYAAVPVANTNSVYTHLYAFYDAGQYLDGTKTPDAWGLGINTQSYINANLAVGKNTAPACALDVVGESHFGGASDYSKFETDGTLAFVGNATVWDDMMTGGLAVKPTGTGDPVLTNFSGGLYLYKFTDEAVAANEKQVQFTIQLAHSYKEGSDITVHVHFIPEDNAGGNCRWGLEYLWANVDGTMAGSTIYVDANCGTATFPCHKLGSFAAISGSGKTISSMLVCRLFRNSSHANDTYNSKSVYLLAADAHFEKDTVGSRAILTK